MLREEVYQATKKIFGLYGAFFDLVGQQVGVEKALDLHIKAHERLGITAGKLFRDKLGKERPDLQELGNILRESNLSIGIESGRGRRFSTPPSATPCARRGSAPCP